MNQRATACLKFHQKNPQVYNRIKEICTRLWGKGWRRFSMRAILYHIRVDEALSTTGEVVRLKGGAALRTKVNNNHSSYYARMLVGEDAKFRQFFEFRHVEGEHGKIIPLKKKTPPPKKTK